METPNCCAISVRKSEIVILSLEQCRTVGDFAARVNKTKTRLFDREDGFLYTIRGPNGVELPLNGPNFNPETPLPNPAQYNPDITARPPMFPVRIRVHDVTRAPYIIIAMVNQRDKFLDLKGNIEQLIKIPADRQFISAQECPIPDGERVLSKSSFPIFNLQIRSFVVFFFKEKSSTQHLIPRHSLSGFLDTFAKSVVEELANLRFVILKASGPRTQRARAWLPDRTELFEAKGVDGTMEENGFVHGDQIQVFRRNTKRNIGSDSKNPTEQGRKRGDNFW